MKPLFKKYDKVMRTDIEKNHVYTVIDVEITEEGCYYSIVRHPTPSKPHWTMSRESNLILVEDI